MSEPDRNPRGRYAPSPTGELHLGNAWAALVAWLSIRSRSGSFVLRMEDLDPARSRPDLARQILRDLAWLGLDWDEGPDVGGPHPPYTQSERGASYDAAFDELRAAGRLYPCFCSRKDIAAAASAPQAPGDELRYPGTCRNLDPEQSLRRMERGDRHAWRFRVPSDARPEFEDLSHGAYGRDRAPSGDFVVRRSDGVTAYQLAVVLDDDAMEIDEVVRGDDLLHSTPRQILLCRALRLKQPAYGHVPLLLGTDGARLSKRHRGITLRELRETGLGAEEVVGRLAWLLELRSTDEPASPRDLLRDFTWERIRPRPEGIVVDSSTWRRAG
jgi:glutamyl-tRNA synthetase